MKDNLKTIEELALNQIEAEILVEELQKLLDAAEEKLKLISTSLLPDAMAEVGMTEFSLENGFRIAIKPVYGASVKSPGAFNWLRNHDLGSLVKTAFKMDFGKGSENEVERTELILRQSGIPFERKEEVHHQTLRALLREKTENGEQLPEEFFNTFIGKQTAITK